TAANLFPRWARPRRGVTAALAGVLLLSGSHQPGSEHAISGLHGVAGRNPHAVGWLFLARLSGRGRYQKNRNWPDLLGRPAAGRRHRHSGLWPDRRTHLVPTWL